MEEEELNGVVNNSQAKRTKKATQWAVTVFVHRLVTKISLYFHFLLQKKYNNNMQGATIQTEIVVLRANSV